MIVVNSNMRLRQQTPYVTLLLIFANLTMELAKFEYQHQLFAYLSFIPARDLNWGMPFLLHSISYQFLHAGWAHLLFNMLALWIFAPALEYSFGHTKLLIYYILGGISAVLLQSLFMGTESHTLIIGASGSIAALMSGFLLLFGRTHLWILLIVIPVRMPAFVFILVWLVLHIIGVASGIDTPIALLAHLGGFIFGLIACIFFKPPQMQFLRRL